MLDNVGLRYPHRASGQKPLALCDRCPCFGSLFPPLAALTFAASSIICAFGLASAAPRSPYRHLELCGIAFKILLHFSLLQHTATAAGGAPCFKWGTACCFDGIETFDLRQNKTPGAIWHPVFQLNNRRNQTGIRGGENRKISLRGTGPAAGRWFAISAWRLPGSCRPQQRRGGRR